MPIAFYCERLNLKCLKQLDKELQRNAKKYVHAYVVGYLDKQCPLDLKELVLDKRITYNPYKANKFHFVNDGYLSPIKNDGTMYFIHGGNGLGHLHLVKYSA